MYADSQPGTVRSRRLTEHPILHALVKGEVSMSLIQTDQAQRASSHSNAHTTQPPGEQSPTDCQNRATTTIGTFAAASNEDPSPGSGTDTIIRVITLFVLGFLFISSLCTYGVHHGIVVGIYLGMMTSLTALLGWIPILGPVAYWATATRWAIPLVWFWAPPVHASWVTTGYLWVGLLASIFYTVCSAVVIWCKVYVWRCKQTYS